MTIKLSRQYLKSLDDGETLYFEKSYNYEMTDSQVAILAKAIAELDD